jgi:hypothetical protein
LSVVSDYQNNGGGGVGVGRVSLADFFEIDVDKY